MICHGDIVSNHAQAKRPYSNSDVLSYSWHTNLFVNAIANGIYVKILIFLIALLVPFVGRAADWDLVQEQVLYSERENVPVALVRSDEGDTFRVYVGDDGTVRGVLTLRRGFNTFSERGCPTYQIDDRASRVVTLPEQPCTLKANQAHFSFGKKSGRKILSTPLHRLMNGKTVVFRFRLDSIGYRQSTFSLRRSKFAVEEAVGRGISIDKE